MDRLNTNVHEACLHINKDCRSDFQMLAKTLSANRLNGVSLLIKFLLSVNNDKSIHLLTVLKQNAYIG